MKILSVTENFSHTAYYGTANCTVLYKKICQMSSEDHENSVWAVAIPRRNSLDEM